MLLVLLAVITPMLLVIIVSLVMRYCRSKSNSKNYDENYPINYDEKSLPAVNLRGKSVPASNFNLQQQLLQRGGRHEQSNCSSETIEMHHHRIDASGPLTHGNIIKGNCDIRPFCSEGTSSVVLSVHNLHQHQQQLKQQQQQQQQQSELGGERDALESNSSAYFPYAATSNALIRAPCQHSSPTVRKSGR